MEIRALEDKDMKVLFLLVKSVYEDSPLSMWFSKSPTELEFEGVFSKKIRNLNDGIYTDLVALNEGRIVGECELLKRDDGTGILGLIVAREFRRKGVASALFDKSLELAKELGIKRINAEVTGENLPAITFLIKKGFLIKGIEEKSLEKEGVHDVLLLQKELPA